MKLFFAVVAVGLILAAVCGAAMAWDGSFQFFTTLNTQALSVPHNRLIALPAQGAVLLLSRLTDNIGILQASFGLVYVVIIIGILVICWWIVRAIAPWLFVWAALGIGLGTLPGQFPLYSEATFVVQLFWPVLLAILTRLQERVMPIVAILGAVIFFTHPLAIPLFFIAGFVAVAVGLFNKEDRPKIWSWALVFVVAGVFRITLIEPGYEADQITMDVLTETFNLSVAGLPLLALIFSWLAGALLFFELRFNKFRQHNLIPLWYSAAAGLIALAAGFLVMWADDILNWRYALGFRTWVLFCSLPFIGLAFLEGLRAKSTAKETTEAEWRRRLSIIRVVAVIFSATLIIQSINWISVTDRLQKMMAQSTSTCIAMDSIDWLIQTPLYHPTVTSYSILLQGRTPQKIVLSGNDCTQADFTTSFPIANWDRPLWATSWFNMQYLSQSLAVDQKGRANK